MELFELHSISVQCCDKDFLLELGFRPSGREYWLFRIKEMVANDVMMSSILEKVNTLQRRPQIVEIEK